MTKLIIIVSVLAVGSWLFSRRRWYAPAVLQTAVWLLCLVLYMWFDKGLHPLKESIIQAVTVWVAGFTLTTWCVQSLHVKPLLQNVTPSVPVRDIYYFFSLATVPLLLWAAASIVRHTGGNPLSALRDANISENDQGVRTTGFFVVFWMVSYIMELRVLTKSNLSRVIVLFLVNLIYVIISMGKMNLLILFLSTAIVLTERGIIKLKHIIIALPLLALLMLGVQYARGWKVTTATKLERFTSLYACSGLGNLNAFVEPCSSERPGENTFRLYYAVKSKLDGGRTPVVNPVLKWRNLSIGHQRYGTNTYTALYPFYKDFGMKGIWVFSILFGLIFGFLFKAAEDGSACALVLYAILAGCIVMQIIGDTFITVLSQNIQYLVAVLIPFVMSKYRLFEKHD